MAPRPVIAGLTMSLQALPCHCGLYHVIAGFYHVIAGFTMSLRALTMSLRAQTRNLHKFFCHCRRFRVGHGMT